MKNGKIVVTGLGIWLVFSAMLLFTVNQGYAFNQKKANKIIKSIQKKHKATVTAKNELYNAIRRYERGKSGTIGLIKRWVVLVEKQAKPKDKRKSWNSAFKRCKTGYKDIKKLYSTWEKKSKALFKELKKLDQELK